MCRRVVPVILLVLVSCVAPRSGECQRAPRVTLFELTPQNLSEHDDLPLKQELEDVLADRLKKEGIVLTRVEHELLDLIKDEGVYARQKKSDFYVTGSFKSLQGQLIVSVRLFRNRNGAFTEVLSSPIPRIPKDLALPVLLPWFEYLSSKIVNIVQGRNRRQTVYTYCFKTFSAEEDEMQVLGRFLSYKLRGELAANNALGKRYEVLGFQREGEVMLICTQSRLDESYLQLYDYVISGQIRPHQNDRVIIGLQISTGGQPRVKEDINQAKDSMRLVGELRKVILTHWPKAGGR